MFKNLKVDIIYHQTASDFEMEFNLCGCCRMRLLTDKSADKKSFVGLLARGVSRSRIIIACGPLFGENGTISTVAAAIGKELCAADNSAYGIKSNDNINIINGSTPLVTPDGLFGGCIIESGPQTIILLSESKAIRKVVMKTLIHPYIEQISMLSDDDGFFSPAAPAPEAVPVSVPAPVAPSPEVIPAPIVPVPEIIPAPDESAESEESVEATEEVTETETSEAEVTETSEEPETATEETLEETAETKDENEAEADASTETSADDSEAAEAEAEVPEPEAPAEPEAKVELPPLVAPEAPDLFLEPEKVKFSEKSSYALDYTPSDSDKLFLSEPVNSKPYHNPINISIIIIAVLLLLCIVAVAVLLVFIPLSRGVSINEYIKNLFDVASASPSSLSIF